MSNNGGATFDIASIPTAVEGYLLAYVHEKKLAAAEIGTQYVTLWHEIERYVKTGGKRIRPMLAAALYQGYGGTHLDDVMPVAASWELLHSSLLVIDDIVDRDEARHGTANIAGRYRKHYRNLKPEEAYHYALSAALLAGDLLLIGSYEVLNESTLPAEQKVAMTRYIQKAFYEVGGGEHEDVQTVLLPIASANPEAIIRYKTAGYSFQLPMLSGAALAGADEAELIKITQLGAHMGMLFQLTDDLLGVFGDMVETGKPNDSDIREKKRTVLLQSTYEALDPTKQKRLSELYDTDYVMNDDDVQSVKQLMIETGAQQANQRMVADEAKHARKVIESMNMDVNTKVWLSGLIEKLEKRVA